jgi:trypsin
MTARTALRACLLTLALSACVPAVAQAQTYQPRIVGGTTAPIESYPYQVRLLIRSGASTYSCGGVIRDATHVLTAAHCVTFGSVVPAGNVTVRYGSASTTSQLSAGVSKISVYNEYVTGADDSYDAALLELPTPLSGYGQGRANPIPIASASTLSSGVTSGATAVATGWGATSEGGSTSTNLRAVNLKLQMDAYCTAKYGTSYVSSRTVCAGGDGTAATNNPDTCQGDSGGPLALDSGSGLQLIGLTSYGAGCGRQLTPGAYAETSNPEILALINGTAPASRLTTTTGSGTITGAPVVPAPVVPAPVKTPARPVAHVSSVACRHRRCSVRVSAGQVNGKVSRVSVALSHRARVCRKGRCRTVTRTKIVPATRSGSAFLVRVKLAPGRYRAQAVAVGTSGKRSLAASRSFRVKR